MTFCHLEFHRFSKAPEDVIPKLCLAIWKYGLGLFRSRSMENPENPENAKPLISVVVVDLQGRVLHF